MTVRRLPTTAQSEGRSGGPGGSQYTCPVILVNCPITVMMLDSRERLVLPRQRRLGLKYSQRVDPDEAVVLTVVSSGAEADIVCGLLRSNGIDCAYRETEAIESSLEDFTAAGPREILVHESDLAAGRELIAPSST